MGYGPHWGAMGGFGGIGLEPFSMLIWALVLILIVAAVIWFVRQGHRPSELARPRRSSAVDVLEERYARGEIEREDYLQKKKDILG